MASKHRVTVGEELRYDSDLQGLRSLSGTYARLTPFDSRDYSTLQLALDAVAANGGGSLYVHGLYSVTSELTYDAQLGPIRIHGNGRTGEIRATGTTNKSLHITGVPGNTGNYVEIEGVKFSSTTSGTSAANLHLDGIAIWGVRNCLFSGVATAAYGILGTAAQQAEISGCRFDTAIGIRLEPSGGGVHSNGVEVHGNFFFCNVAHIVAVSVDSGFYHSNHMVVAPLAFDIGTGGFGAAVISGNHIESHTTAGVRAAAVCVIDGNQFFGAPGTDINITGGTGSVISNNLIQQAVTLGAGASGTKFYGNLLTGAASLTDSSSTLQAWGNTGVAGATGGSLQDKMSITSRDGAAGNILTLNPNGAVGGSWGMRIGGAGASSDVYLQLNDAILAGNTTGGELKVKSGVGGTEWARFTSAGVRGFPGIIATGAAPTTGAGEVAIGGTTATTVGVAGAASAPPATPDGYIIVNVAGAAKKIPYYAT